MQETHLVIYAKLDSVNGVDDLVHGNIARLCFAALHSIQYVLGTVEDS